MNVKNYLSQRRAVVDKAIKRYIPKGGKYTGLLHNAVKYSLMSGGKRIRPVLALAACEAVSGSFGKAVPVAVAIEMIHTYTLIHDDLPAMDDDDLRRGKPACHKVFGEDVAILAGDMLNTLAFEIIAKHQGTSASLIAFDLSRALGIDGVAGGQLADLRSKGKKTGMKELNFISSRKTASLFVASVRCGAIAGGATGRVLPKLTEYARHLGLAFQIIDDILDHKPGSKNSYPALLGMQKSKSLAKSEIDKATGALPGGKGYGALRAVALFLSERKE